MKPRRESVVDTTIRVVGIGGALASAAAGAGDPDGHERGNEGDHQTAAPPAMSATFGESRPRDITVYPWTARGTGAAHDATIATAPGDDEDPAPTA